MVPSDDLEAPLIRVLLTRTSKPVTMPQPGRAWRLTADSRSQWLWGPLTITGGQGAQSFQVGAFSGQGAALEAVRKLKQVYGDAINSAVVPADDGLFRVRVHWPTSQPADPKDALASAGFPGAFTVVTGGMVRIQGQGGVVVSEEEILLEPAGDLASIVVGRSYRGRFRVRSSGAGEILVINELNLERYLLGVVPAEMGPSVFPEVEALKAQAVAARTYAVAHLGDHDAEGYDICDTPACQVYSGAGAEHSLSTRAIEETSGLVAVFDGKPIDAMYTSTCGGHTEDSSELFSGRAQPYLQGVPCRWDRDLLLAGITNGAGGAPALLVGEWKSATDFEAVVARRVLGLDASASPAVIIAALAREAGTVAGLTSAVTVESFSWALLEAGGLTRSAEILSPEASALERLLFLADLYKAPLNPPIDGLQSSWPAAAALAVLEMTGNVVRDRGEAVPRPGGVGIFPRRANASEMLPPALPLWERWRDGYRQSSAGSVHPGTELERLRRGDEVVALVIRRSGGSSEADRRSAWREWVREKPWSELAGRLGIPDLEKLEITRRTDFGRVVGLAAVGRSGTRKEWKGFDVRRALDLPETLFTISVVTRPDGAKVARFLGRGWGHGVGLCQNGSYGLARSGMTFDRILGHYYSGIQLVRWSDLP